ALFISIAEIPHATAGSAHPTTKTRTASRSACVTHITAVGSLLMAPAIKIMQPNSPWAFSPYYAAL
ncbi:MAG: hypothetical protein WA769_08045, partial [Pseudolabrys sp.]